MFEIRETAIFAAWLSKLADRQARSRILVRIERLATGLTGDIKPVGGGVSELRIDTGPGYRVYFVRHEKTLILLLCGGDKKTQARDIERAKRLAADLKNGA